MPNLLELQRDFKAAVLSGEASDSLISALEPGVLNATDRLKIHGNNYRQTLTAALAGIFPVAQAFVGDEFLGGMLRRYVLEVPPQEAVLSVYGQGVPAFARSFSPAQNIPYLADIMALEWAVHELQHAREQRSHDSTALRAALKNGPLCLSPNARMVDSAFPVLNLWMAGTGQIPPEAVHVKSGGQCACAVLTNGEVRLFGLSGELTDYLAMVLSEESPAAADGDDAFDQLAAMGLLSIDAQKKGKACG